MMSKLDRGYAILAEEGPVILLQKAINYYSSHLAESIYWIACRTRAGDHLRLASILFVIYRLLAKVHYRSNGYCVKKEENRWKLTNLNTGEVFESPTFRELSKGTLDTQRSMKEKYEQPGFVELSDGDTVLEVGSYLGAFTTQISDQAEIIIAVDPFYALDEVYKANIDSYDNIYPISKAAWNEQKLMDLNLSYNPSENSLLDVDSRSTGETIKVSADTVPNILSEFDLDTIDYLKIEAEGAEPEILAAAIAVEPKKIVVSADEERYGESPMDEITQLLNENSYEIQTSGYMIYAKKDE